MRIIGGTAGGRILKAPKGFDVRPTADLVRQAVFNSLGERVGARRVLELFGGTGALKSGMPEPRGSGGVLCRAFTPSRTRHPRELRVGPTRGQLA